MNFATTLVFALLSAAPPPLTCPVQGPEHASLRLAWERAPRLKLNDPETWDAVVLGPDGNVAFRRLAHSARCVDAGLAVAFEPFEWVLRLDAGRVAIDASGLRTRLEALWAAAPGSRVAESDQLLLEVQAVALAQIRPANAESLLGDANDLRLRELVEAYDGVVPLLSGAKTRPPVAFSSSERGQALLARWRARAVGRVGFKVHEPRSIGTIPSLGAGNPLPTPWSGTRLCVPQDEAAKTFRCHDLKTAKWSGLLAAEKVVGLQGGERLRGGKTVWVKTSERALDASCSVDLRGSPPGSSVALAPLLDAKPPFECPDEILLSPGKDWGVALVHEGDDNPCGGNPRCDLTPDGKFRLWVFRAQ